MYINKGRFLNRYCAETGETDVERHNFTTYTQRRFLAKFSDNLEDLSVPVILNFNIDRAPLIIAPYPRGIIKRQRIPQAFKSELEEMARKHFSRLAMSGVLEYKSIEKLEL